MPKAIINGKIVTEDGVTESGTLIFDEEIKEAGTDVRIGDLDDITDAKGNFVIPGLVDIHIHGYMGYDVSDCEKNDIVEMSKALPQNGVTAWCPTTMTVAQEDIQTSLDIIGELTDRCDIGAKIMGANMEGPFINPLKKGAQAAEHIKKPNIDFVMKNKENIKLLTIAPEEDDCGFIEYISKNTDIVISMGHTNATYDQGVRGIESGARHITHLFNAMPPLNHREIGLIGAAFEDERISCEMIADTFHINPHLFKTVERIKGSKLVLITDCMRAGGMPDGEYTLGGQKVDVKGCECRLKDGTIAGSVLRLNRGVKNFADYTGLPIHKAVAAASLYPARVIGVDHKQGSIKKGKYADIAIVDKDFDVIKTYVNGNVCFSK